MAAFFLMTMIAGAAAGAELVVHVGVERGDIRGQDNRAVQAAIDYVANLGGGIVHIAAGRYTLHDSIQLRTGVKLVGVPGKTMLTLAPGGKCRLAANVTKGSQEVTLADGRGFAVGQGIALEDRAGHGFEVTTTTLVGRLGPNRFRLSRPAESEYLLTRNAEAKRAISGIGAWNISNAAALGITVEGNLAVPGSEYLGGCRGGGIYLYACKDVSVSTCTIRQFNGDAISFQGKCQNITIEECLCEHNANVGMHPGSGSHSCIVRKNLLRSNGYVGLFVCVDVRKVLFADNEIRDNRGCGISIGFGDSDNVFRGNHISGNAETGVLFRRDSTRAEDGAQGNVFEENIIRDNLLPRPAKSNSRPGSAGRACVVIEGQHDGLIFRNNTFGFATLKGGAAILHDRGLRGLQVGDNRLQGISQLCIEHSD